MFKIKKDVDKYYSQIYLEQRLSREKKNGNEESSIKGNLLIPHSDKNEMSLHHFTKLLMNYFLYIIHKNKTCLEIHHKKSWHVSFLLKL